MSDSFDADISEFEVQNALLDSIREVAQFQAELWRLRAGERAIAGQIFANMHKRSWPAPFVVDAEWEREGAAGARKGSNQNPEVTPDPNGAGSTRPDLCVHVRGASGAASNLLIAEFKLDALDTPAAIEDVEKVRRLMSRFGYRFGAVVSLGRDSTSQIAVEWYSEANGRPIISDLDMTAHEYR